MLRNKIIGTIDRNLPFAFIHVFRACEMKQDIRYWWTDQKEEKISKQVMRISCLQNVETVKLSTGHYISAFAIAIPRGRMHRVRIVHYRLRSLLRTLPMHGARVDANGALIGPRTDAAE